MVNSVDPDQTASPDQMAPKEEAICSGSSLFAKVGLSCSVGKRLSINEIDKNNKFRSREHF